MGVKLKIPRELSELETQLENLLGAEKSFDVGKREFMFHGRRVMIFYITGLIDSILLVEAISQMMIWDASDVAQPSPFDALNFHLAHFQVEVSEDLEQVYLQILSGLVVWTMDGENRAFIADLRSYPGRGPAEPDTEKTVRGSRDGYTENIIINTALTRRRIRTGNLKNEIFKVGLESQTDVAMLYMEGLADPKTVDLIRRKIQQIEVDNLTMTDKQLEELITGQVFNPYPLVRYTERPDVVATHLYRGLIAIIADTSPSVILAPISFFDHITSVEEYRQTPAVGTFLRIIRFGGMLMSVFMMPTWLLVVLHPEYLPSALNYIGPQQEGHINIILQVIFGELGIEFIRLASIHTPSAISSALGIVSAMLIGQVAVDIGLFGPEILFYVAIGTLGGFVTPSYEMGLANKMFKMFIILGVVLLGLWGYIGAVVIGFIYLATLKSFGQPYLYPLIPFNFKELIQFLIRVPSPWQYRARKRKRENRNY